MRAFVQLPKKECRATPGSRLHGNVTADDTGAEEHHLLVRVFEERRREFMVRFPIALRMLGSSCISPAASRA
jgi:hypothetical protein